MPEAVLVSACLLGIPCRYDGGSKPVADLAKLLQNFEVIPICPEALGGLVSPRPPAEIRNGDGTLVLAGKARVVNKEGTDCTAQFLNGAEAVLKKATALNPKLIILKSKSPSCGIGLIYDGSFSGKLKQGDGVTAALLRRAGFSLYSENDFLRDGLQNLGRDYS